MGLQSFMKRARRFSLLSVDANVLMKAGLGSKNINDPSTTMEKLVQSKNEEALFHKTFTLTMPHLGCYRLHEPHRIIVMKWLAVGLQGTIVSQSTGFALTLAYKFSREMLSLN